MEKEGFIVYLILELLELYMFSILPSFISIKGSSSGNPAYDKVQ